jgi:hypothetical protein
MLPGAPGWPAKGQPPSPPSVLSKRDMPRRSAAWALAMPTPRVSCGCRMMESAGQQLRIWVYEIRDDLQRCVRAIDEWSQERS